MAVYLANTGVLTVNAVDLSSLVSNVTINRAFDELEITSLGDLGHRFTKGLESSSISIDFFNDSATAKTLQTLNSSSVWGNNVVVTFKQKDAVVSAENPLYTMTCLVNNTTPVSGDVQSLSVQSVTWNVSGTIAVTTAP
jgi:hypothetical protein